MKAIDSYFKFPIRVFDPHSSRAARRAAEAEFGERVHVEHVKGYASIPYSEARALAFHDTFMAHREIDNVKTKGFDSTSVLTPTMGDYMCTWSRERFEVEFSAYLDRMDAYIDAERQKEAAAFATQVSENADID